MKNDSRIAVVIPCYRVSDAIEQVIVILPEMVDHIIVVDDACPDGSGKVAESLGHEKVCVIYHENNQGVGGAVISGYKKALELGCDIVIKVDGDGQMDPCYIPALIEPLIKNEADYTKGNRFYDFQALRNMPKIRLFGNNILSFMEKLFSGYWSVMDPTNGYTAIHRRILEKLNFHKIAKGYFFESHMLLNLNLINAVVHDVPMPARYGGENSSLNIRKTLIEFPPRLFYGLCKRIFFKYLIYDFNMASVYLLLGIPMFLWSVIFGLYHWIDSYRSGVPKTAGVIMLAALPLILSVEMLLQAINIDIQSAQRNQAKAHTAGYRNEKMD